MPGTIKTKIMKLDKQYFKMFHPQDWQSKWERYQKQECIFSIVLAIFKVMLIITGLLFLKSLQ